MKVLVLLKDWGHADYEVLDVVHIENEKDAENIMERWNEKQPQYAAYQANKFEIYEVKRV